MKAEYLVKMANEIGDFFASEPDRGQAAREVAYHLKRFWDPRMRREIIAHLEQGAVGLSDIARNAVALLAAANHEAK